MSPSGEEHYHNVKKNIPIKYSNCVKDILYIKNGRIYETLLKEILKNTIKGINITYPPAIFPRENIDEQRGGYLHPDLKINNHIYVEVTTWGDSNMIFSKIMQGYLLKKQLAKEKARVKYYVLIADLGLDDWTWDNDKDDFWERWNNIEGLIPVDAWFGFKDVDRLIDLIVSDLQ